MPQIEQITYAMIYAQCFWISTINRRQNVLQEPRVLHTVARQSCKDYIKLVIINCAYSPFHKTLPRFCLLMHLISVRFYEEGDTYS